MHPRTRHANRPGVRHYATLALVFVSHAVLLAVILRSTSHTPHGAAAQGPLELLAMPPPAIPLVRAENAPKLRPSAQTVQLLAPPELARALEPQARSPSSGRSPRASDTDGRESGVDWAAEARRALQAFEIRGHEPVRNTSVSTPHAEEHWWPRSHHAAGEHFKTPGGDWIVWINARCYQVARAVPPGSQIGAAWLPTTCLGDGTGEDAGDETAVDSQGPPADAATDRGSGR